MVPVDLVEKIIILTAASAVTISLTKEWRVFSCQPEPIYTTEYWVGGDDHNGNYRSG